MSDLYEILQVDSTASKADIKKAYRKLALRYHPDKVSEEDREEAEIKFKEISRAYEVLIDEQKREAYDTYGTTDGPGGVPNFSSQPFDGYHDGHEYAGDDFFNFFNGMNNNGARRANRTEDAELEVKVTLEDLFNGKTVKITSTRNIICPHCVGTGARKKAVTKKCAACDGEGTVRKIRRVGPGLISQEYVDCLQCQGSGKLYRSKDKCKKCLGDKTVEETKILEFEIAKGSANNGSIVLKHESDEYPGKETGDVILNYTCEEHPTFTRVHNDLYCKYKIPLVDALCGFSRNVVKHLDGRVLRVETPKGKVLRPHDFIRIKNEGMPIVQKRSWFTSGPSHGDLYIEIEVEFPQDNWYLEKNDIFQIKNLLPNDLQSKHDIKKQHIDEEAVLDANIDVADFTIVTRSQLPEYEEPQHTHRAPPQAECTTQ